MSWAFNVGVAMIAHSAALNRPTKISVLMAGVSLSVLVVLQVWCGGVQGEG